MEKLIFCSLLLFSNIYYSQIHDKYPEGQKSYMGEEFQFYIDVKKAMQELEINDCGDEIANIQVVVYQDGSIKMVKPEGQMYEESKCTFDAMKKILPKLTEWNAAEVNGEKVNALTSRFVYLKYLKNNNVEAYDPSTFYKPANFPGGMNEFRKKIFNRVAPKGFSSQNGDFSLVVHFNVDKAGKIDEIYLSKETNNATFNKIILNGVSSIKTKWEPATFHDIITSGRYNLPLRFKFEN